jgi:hypothetical protein
MDAVSAVFMPSGFSQMTCLPAASAARDCYFGNSPLRRGLFSAVSRSADGGDLNAETLESFDVNWSDKPRADHAGAKLM